MSNRAHVDSQIEWLKDLHNHVFLGAIGPSRITTVVREIESLRAEIGNLQEWNSPMQMPKSDEPVLAKSDRPARPYSVAYFNNILDCWTDWDSANEVEDMVGWRPIAELSTQEQDKDDE